MSKTLTYQTLMHAGRAALNLTYTLTQKKTRERWLHGVVLGLLEGLVGNMQNEFAVEDSNRVKKKPKCIDFRHGSSNPDVIELVVRMRGGELYGSQNKSELLKLCKIPDTQARRRILLLLDPSGLDPIAKHDLKRTYSYIGTGSGNFPRKTVTIVYIHPDLEYLFRWRP